MARGEWGGTLETKPWQCKISWLVGLSQQQTGFHLRATALAFPSPTDVANEVADFANESFRTILANSDKLLGVDVVNMVTGEGGSVSFSNVMGTVAATTFRPPSYVTANATLKGELRRRYGQGGMRLPVAAESFTNDDVLNSTGLAALQGMIDEMTSRYIDGGVMPSYVLCNVHGVLPPKAATPKRPARPEIPASWYDVTSIRLNSAVSFLRSRKQGVGA